MFFCYLLEHYVFVSISICFGLMSVVAYLVKNKVEMHGVKFFVFKLFTLLSRHTYNKLKRNKKLYVMFLKAYVIN